MIMEFLICLSTVFVKMHYFIDIPAAILLAEAAGYAAGKADTAGKLTFL